MTATPPFHPTGVFKISEEWSMAAAKLVDWTRPLETTETPPRQVRVLGEHRGGSVDYVDVFIEDNGRPPHPLRTHAHPPGEYCAEKASGHIRGDLAVRNRKP